MNTSPLIRIRHNVYEATCDGCGWQTYSNDRDELGERVARHAEDCHRLGVVGVHPDVWKVGRQVAEQ